MNKQRTSWIELEDGMLTNTPAGTDKPPTEAWLFTWECTRLKQSVRRKRQIVNLKCSGDDDLDHQILAFVKRPDVIYLGAA